MIAAVVPVKALASSKSRLLPQLGRPALERLTIAMLCDVLAALQELSMLDRIAVVTPDPSVAKVAERVGAEAVVCELVGLNPSVEEACGRVALAADDAALVVLGDVAGAQAQDLETLLQALPERGVVLSPSSDGGTSALLRRPREIIAAGFGPGSAALHRKRALRAGVCFQEISLPSLAIDIDEREDLEKFVHSQTAGTQTRSLLRELLPEWAS
jgi:2-phospho-L-lactate guanylyltransferase